MIEERKFLLLNDIEAYRIGFHLSNYVWEVVILWEYFEKKTVGMQFVRAVDSISANLAEGFGRYYKRIRSTSIDMHMVQSKKALTGMRNVGYVSS